MIFFFMEIYERRRNFYQELFSFLIIGNKQNRHQWESKFRWDHDATMLRLIDLIIFFISSVNKWTKWNGL